MLIPWHFGPGSQYILILQHFLPFSNIYPLPYPLRELLALASRFPPPWSGAVVWLKGNAHEKKLQEIHRDDISQISAIEPQHRRSG